MGENNNRDRSEFNDLINELQLIEISFMDRKFTWSNMREIPSMTNLDRVMVSTEWEDRIGLAWTIMIKRPISDHIPISL